MGGNVGVITSRQKQQIRMLTHFNSMFKNIPCMVLIELGPKGEGDKEQAITISLSPQCRSYNGSEKLKVTIPAILHRWAMLIPG